MGKATAEITQGSAIIPQRSDQQSFRLPQRQSQGHPQGLPQGQPPRHPFRHPSDDLRSAAGEYLAASQADSTRSSYRRAWDAFLRWCSKNSGGDLLRSRRAAVELVALYLTYSAERGLAVSTIERSAAAIRSHLATHYEENPCDDHGVRVLLEGIRRRKGRPPARKSPLMATHMLGVVRQLGWGVRGARDRCALLLGFAAALRRSELVALDLGDLEVRRDDAGELAGLRVRIRRSKTDQRGDGRDVGVAMGSHRETCPVRATLAWIAMLRERGVEQGALLCHIAAGDRITSRRLSDRQIARMVKRAAASVGLDARAFSGHSLRAGLATSAARAGKTDRAIMAQTGHRSHAMLSVYVRDAKLLDEDNASGNIGL